MNARLISGVAKVLVIGVTAATVLAGQPPAWVMLLLGSTAWLCSIPSHG
jgi:hypothetical protein